MLKNGLLTTARPAYATQCLNPSITARAVYETRPGSSIRQYHAPSTSGSSSNAFYERRLSSSTLASSPSGVRCLHTSPVVQKGKARPQRSFRMEKTRGSSRTKLAKYVAPQKPFTGNGAFASPYSRAPSMDPANQELSATELYMRARANVVKGKVGGSVYRRSEWNHEVKAKPRPFGLAGDIRKDDDRRRDSSRDTRYNETSRYDRRSTDSRRSVDRNSPRNLEVNAKRRPFDEDDEYDDVSEHTGRTARQREPRGQEHWDWLSRNDWQAKNRHAVEQPEPSEEQDASTPAVDVWDTPPPSAAQQQFSTAPIYQPPKRRLPKEFTDTPLMRPPSFDSTGLLTTFSTPPLMPGLATSVAEILGTDASPTAIQQLSLSRLIQPPYTSSSDFDVEHSDKGWTQTLLASETGSGKTLAYMLPLLHGLKHTELHSRAVPEEYEHRNFPMMPRALVIAPTHELARQLASAAKKLSHNIKLRVLCGSRENKPSSGGAGSRLRDLKLLGPQGDRGADTDTEFTITREGAAALGLGVTPHNRPIDVLTATPSHILELVRGNGWERRGEIIRDPAVPRDPGRPWEVGPPTMGLDKIEWVCIDEADVLLDPDFREQTLGILDEVAQARSHFLSSSSAKSALPFHLLLNSATIPGLLSATIDERWPAMQRLASPGVHRLPSGMKTEHVSATGNRMADVVSRIKSIWAEEGRRAVQSAEDRERANFGLRVLGGAARSKVLVFVNRGSKAAELSEYLNTKGIANVALTGTHGRAHGSNRHLAGFLNPSSISSTSMNSKPKPTVNAGEDDGKDVLVTTSLLSRGLDFSPEVRHVLIVDEPRNVVDLLHRAGRSARAGRTGIVTVFGKGAKGAKEVGRAVRGLEA